MSSLQAFAYVKGVTTARIGADWFYKGHGLNNFVQAK